MTIWFEKKEVKMSSWYEHDGVFYNLNKFYQICRGDENEILLADLSQNMDWDHDDEEKICSLKFESNEKRNLEMDKIKKLLIEDYS